MAGSQWLFMLAALAASGVSWGARVDCSVVVRSEEKVVRLAPVDTPYQFTKIDYDNGFRFAGQLAGQPLKLKTYAYIDSKERYVLIHQNIQVLESAACNVPLGTNTVYTPQLENELSYTCTRVCD